VRKRTQRMRVGKQMNESDRALGMDKLISRRDFVNGVSVTIGASLLPSFTGLNNLLDPGQDEFAPEKQPGYYPPTKTGMRGSHDGSWEVAHAMRGGKQWGTPVYDDQVYDLIVVGGGISGLSAAYFYREAAGPKARILVLDNHDDFGGHAKRNEFHTSSRMLIGYGGAQTITSPDLYSREAKQLFQELGIEVKRF
jgi:spermidine dehydrogenase